MLLLERQAEQSEIGVLLPRLAAPTVGFYEVLLALLELVLVGDQSLDAVLEQALLVGEIEVHGQRPNIALATMLRWISFEPP